MLFFTSVMTIVILTIIILTVVGQSAPDLQGSGNNISATTLPLALLFDGSGVVFFIFMAFVIVALVGSFTFNHR